MQITDSFAYIGKNIHIPAKSAYSLRLTNVYALNTPKAIGASLINNANIEAVWDWVGISLDLPTLSINGYADTDIDIYIYAQNALGQSGLNWITVSGIIQKSA